MQTDPGITVADTYKHMPKVHNRVTESNRGYVEYITDVTDRGTKNMKHEIQIYTMRYMRKYGKKGTQGLNMIRQ